MKLPLMGGLGPAAETSSHLTPPSSDLQRGVSCELDHTPLRTALAPRSGAIIVQRGPDDRFFAEGKRLK